MVSQMDTRNEKLKTPTRTVINLVNYVNPVETQAKETKGRKRTKINSRHLMWSQQSTEKKKDNPCIYVKRQRIQNDNFFTPKRAQKFQKYRDLKKAQPNVIRNAVLFNRIVERVLHFAYQTVFAATTCACGLNGAAHTQKKPHLKTNLLDTPCRHDKSNFPHNIPRK